MRFWSILQTMVCAIDLFDVISTCWMINIEPWKGVLSMIMLGLHAGPQNKGCNCLLCRLILRTRSEPDLWRDCDFIWRIVAWILPFALFELTWFMKGLRRVISVHTFGVTALTIRILTGLTRRTSGGAWPGGFHIERESLKGKTSVWSCSLLIWIRNWRYLKIWIFTADSLTCLFKAPDQAADTQHVGLAAALSDRFWVRHGRWGKVWRAYIHRIFNFGFGGHEQHDPSLCHFHWY